MNMKEFYKQYEEKDIGDLSSNEKKITAIRLDHRLCRWFG